MRTSEAGLLAIYKNTVNNNAMFIMTAKLEYQCLICVCKYFGPNVYLNVKYNKVNKIVIVVDNIPNNEEDINTNKKKLITFNMLLLMIEFVIFE